MPSVYVDTTTTVEDVELYLLPPDLALDDSSARLEAQATEIELTRGPALQWILTVKAALDSDLCTRSYSGATALEDRWAGWVLALYVRGTLVFEGPILGWHLVWGGSMVPGSSYESPGSRVTVSALSWFSALLRRRAVETSTGNQYYIEDYPNRIYADLIRTSMVSGAVATPTGWQKGSETRDDLGNVSVACAVPTGVGSTMRFWADRGDNVLDTCLELGMMPSTTDEWVWPTQSRSGTTITFGFQVGRSGGSRGIGSDRSSHVGGGAISAERGILVGYEEEGDRLSKGNHLLGMGRGRQSKQKTAYAASASDIASEGVFENVALIPSGSSTEEVGNELQLQLNQQVNGENVRSYRIAETSEFYWPGSFDVGDTLPFLTPFGESVAEVCLGLKWRLAGKGPARIELETGNWPTPAERRMSRSGGGGGGGRGGGGRGRGKSGEPLLYGHIVTDNGTVEAHEQDTGLQLIGDTAQDAAAVVRAKTAGSNSDTDGTDDTVQVKIIGTFTAGDPSANGTIEIECDDGSVYELLAKDPKIV